MIILYFKVQSCLELTKIFLFQAFVLLKELYGPSPLQNRLIDHRYVLWTTENSRIWNFSYCDQPGKTFGFIYSTLFVCLWTVNKIIFGLILIEFGSSGSLLLQLQFFLSIYPWLSKQLIFTKLRNFASGKSVNALWLSKLNTLVKFV